MAEHVRKQNSMSDIPAESQVLDTPGHEENLELEKSDDSNEGSVLNTEHFSLEEDENHFSVPCEVRDAEADDFTKLLGDDNNNKTHKDLHEDAEISGNSVTEVDYDDDSIKLCETMSGEELAAEDLSIVKDKGDHGLNQDHRTELSSDHAESKKLGPVSPKRRGSLDTSRRSRSRSRSRSRERERERERGRARSRSRSPSSYRREPQRIRSRSPANGSKRVPDRLSDRERTRGGGTEPCRNFAAGRCHMGSECRYLHEDGERRQTGRHFDTAATEIRDSRSERLTDRERTRGGGLESCRNFAAGRCHKGTECRYLHDESERRQTGGQFGNAAMGPRDGRSERLIDKEITRKYSHDENERMQSGGRYDSSAMETRDSRSERFTERDRTLGGGLEACRNFAAGRCQKGSECRYLHDRSGLESCRNFAAGRCQKGNECRYLHGESERRQTSRHYDSAVYEARESRTERGKYSTSDSREESDYSRDVHSRDNRSTVKSYDLTTEISQKRSIEKESSMRDEIIERGHDWRNETNERSQHRRDEVSEKSRHRWDEAIEKSLHRRDEASEQTQHRRDEIKEQIQDTRGRSPEKRGETRDRIHNRRDETRGMSHEVRDETRERSMDKRVETRERNHDPRDETGESTDRRAEPRERNHDMRDETRERGHDRRGEIRERDHNRRDGFRERDHNMRDEIRERDHDRRDDTRERGHDRRDETRERSPDRRGGHPSSGRMQEPPYRTPCKFFAERRCKMGASCRFSHQAEERRERRDDRLGYTRDTNHSSSSLNNLDRDHVTAVDTTNSSRRRNDDSSKVEDAGLRYCRLDSKSGEDSGNHNWQQNENSVEGQSIKQGAGDNIIVPPAADPQIQQLVPPMVQHAEMQQDVDSLPQIVQNQFTQIQKNPALPGGEANQHYFTEPILAQNGHGKNLLLQPASNSLTYNPNEQLVNPNDQQMQVEEASVVESSLPNVITSEQAAQNLTATIAHLFGSGNALNAHVDMESLKRKDSMGKDAEINISSPAPSICGIDDTDSLKSVHVKAKVHQVVANNASKEERKTGPSKNEHAKEPSAKRRKTEEKKEGKDSKAMRLFTAALVDFVKEVLKPSWKEGHLSKDAHKTIVKKVVEKVTGSIQGPNIPQTPEKIDLYLNHSSAKLNKLVLGYVDKYVKS